MRTESWTTEAPTDPLTGVVLHERNPLIELADRYPCKLSSLPSLWTLELHAFMTRNRSAWDWIRRRIDAIEYLEGA